MFPLSITKLNTFKKFKRFNKSKEPWIFLLKNDLDFHSEGRLNELNRLNNLNGRRFGAGDGDRTRDVQLGKLAFYR